MILGATTTIEPLQLLLLGGVIIVVVVVMVNTRRRTMERGQRPEAYAREQMNKLREQSAMRDDIAELMMRLEELAREINGQVDTRFAKLEKALADADARIAELKRLGAGQARDVAAAESDETPTPPAEDTSGPAEEQAQPELEEQPDRDDAPEDDAEIATTDRSGPTEDLPRLAPAEDEPETGDSIDAEVIALAREGLPAVEIARRLGRHVGEIELIIKLKGRDRLA